MRSHCHLKMSWNNSALVQHADKKEFLNHPKESNYYSHQSEFGYIKQLLQYFWEKKGEVWNCFSKQWPTLSHLILKVTPQKYETWKYMSILAYSSESIQSSENKWPDTNFRNLFFFYRICTKIWRCHSNYHYAFDDLRSYY